MSNKLFPMLGLSLGVDVATARDFTGESHVYKHAGERALHLFLDKPAEWKSGELRPGGPLRTENHPTLV